MTKYNEDRLKKVEYNLLPELNTKLLFFIFLEGRLSVRSNPVGPPPPSHLYRNSLTLSFHFSKHHPPSIALSKAMLPKLIQGNWERCKLMWRRAERNQCNP